jgi:ceramide glucosyltransferase
MRLGILFYIGWSFLCLGLIGGAYAVLATALTKKLLTRPAPPLPAALPAITLLKPLHGGEPGLEEALASFLAQDYPAPVQFIFGLQNPDDPAHEVVKRLKTRFPARDIALVSNSAAHGSNAKISNIINMMAKSRHDVLVLADSDIAVEPDYLKAVMAALSQPGVGAVSCLYHGEARTGLWSQLAAMGVSYHFLPNASVGIGLSMAHPCFGSTIALSRQTLNRIGGFEAFADLLADDYEIGRAVRETGQRIAYPPLAVTHGNTEASFGALIGHELRWARTIRIIDPAGHAGSLVTHALPLGLIGAGLAGFTPTTLAGLATIMLARLFLKTRIDDIVASNTAPGWLLPVRDVLSFGLFIASLFGQRVEWRGTRLRVEKTGEMSQS